MDLKNCCPSRDLNPRPSGYYIRKLLQKGVGSNPSGDNNYFPFPKMRLFLGNFPTLCVISISANTEREMWPAKRVGSLETISNSWYGAHFMFILYVLIRPSHLLNIQKKKTKSSKRLHNLNKHFNSLRKRVEKGCCWVGILMKLEKFF